MDNKELTIAALNKKEKSKWALAMRRYIIEGVPNQNYAPYFGLDSKTMREWIEVQFDNGLSWDNYAKDWQFDHIVPVFYFDLKKEEDLMLCWNFINIRVEPISANKARGNRVDVLAVRAYFKSLYDKTGFSLAQKMLDKIQQIEVSAIESSQSIENFIINNKSKLETISTLTKEEFNNYNQGQSIEDIMAERELLKKFGY